LILKVMSEVMTYIQWSIIIINVRKLLILLIVIIYWYMLFHWWLLWYIMKNADDMMIPLFWYDMSIQCLWWVLWWCVFCYQYYDDDDNINNNEIMKMIMKIMCEKLFLWSGWWTWYNSMEWYYYSISDDDIEMIQWL